LGFRTNLSSIANGAIEQRDVNMMMVDPAVF
jgi:hypothetical protein